MELSIQGCYRIIPLVGPSSRLHLQRLGYPDYISNIKRHFFVPRCNTLYPCRYYIAGKLVVTEFGPQAFIILRTFLSDKSLYLTENNPVPVLMVFAIFRSFMPSAFDVLSSYILCYRPDNAFMILRCFGYRHHES